MITKLQSVDPERLYDIEEGTRSNTWISLKGGNRIDFLVDWVSRGTGI